MILLSILIFALVWVFIIAPLVLAIPTEQQWLENEHRNSGIRIFLFWPYYLIQNNLHSKKYKETK